MQISTQAAVDPAPKDYQQARIAHWDRIARRDGARRGWGGYYHARLASIYRHLVPSGGRVLEIGCAQGDLLAALQPAYGVGIDFSAAMLEIARRRHPELHFVQADAHDLCLETAPFDAVILSEVVNDLWDVQAVLDRIRPLCAAHTRIILNFYSRIWEIPLAVARRLGLATPNLYQNWLTRHDVARMLDLADFEVIREWQDVLWPLPFPILARLFNQYLGRIWPFRLLSLTNVIVARPRPDCNRAEQPLPVVSVIVPARNEAGNVEAIFTRTPEMGAGTELVFVEGHSKDDTYAAIQAAIARHPERRCQLFRQTGVGKGDAVRLGFAQAQGEILMILDADLTVPPEDLPRFYQALASGKGEFINGVRLIYPMEQEAMRFFNFLGNKFFSLAFSWLLGQPVKDTLCGTKVLWASDYAQIAANRSYFGDFDPFGDYDLLFGAARLNKKIVDVAVRYRERTYGSTNISRWKHGWLLLRMVAYAARRLKFIY